MKLAVTESVIRLQHSLHENGLDAAVAFSPENVAWLAEFMVPSHPIMRRRHAAAVVTEDGAALVVADMEKTTAEQESGIANIVSYREFFQNPMEIVGECIKAMSSGAKRVGIEMEFLPASDFGSLQRFLKGIELVPCDGLFTSMRMVKTEREIKLLRRIAKIAEEVHQELLSYARPGTTERDLARKILDEVVARGGRSIKLMVVGSGSRSRLPNAPFTDRKLVDGDVVRVDIIANLDHYYSDIARTFVVGHPKESQRRMWDHLVSVQQTIYERIKPGASTSEIYHVYERKFEEYGLPTATFLGHGIGLFLHERPYVCNFEDVQLQPGMVLCIEPFHFASDEGYHLEDEIVITQSGLERLTHGDSLLDIPSTGSY